MIAYVIIGLLTVAFYSLRERGLANPWRVLFVFWFWWIAISYWLIKAGLRGKELEGGESR